MLSKFKILFKVAIATIIIFILLFGFYRREYISQAIPVYIQYLKMKQKWKAKNSGNYVVFYGDRCLQPSYYFIKDNRLVYILSGGYPPQYKYLIKGDKILKYISQGAFCRGYKNSKKLLIEERFNDIVTILWDKLWDKTPFEKKGLQYPIEIGYDIEYGYPRGILIKGGGYNGCIKIEEGKPYFKFLNEVLQIFKKNNTLSEKNIKTVLKSPIFSTDKKDNYRYEKKDTVGGNIIKSYLIELVK